MAAAIATISSVVKNNAGPLIRATSSLAIDTGDYATGGVSVPLTSICPDANEAVLVAIDDIVLSNVVYQHEYDYTNEKVIIYELKVNVTSGTAGNAVTLNAGNDFQATDGGKVLIDKEEYADSTAIPGSYSGIAIRVIGAPTL